MSFYLLNPDDKGAMQMWKQALLRVHIRVLAEIFFKFNPFLLGGKVFLFSLAYSCHAAEISMSGQREISKVFPPQSGKGLDGQVRDLW